MKICRVRKCNVERPVLPYFCSKLFELQVPFLNFLNLFGVLDPCDCGFPKLGPKTSMIFADTREFTRSTLPDAYEPSWCFNVSVKENTHFFLGLVPTPLMNQNKKKRKKKKKKGGGKKNYTRELQLLRRLFIGYGRACCYFLAVLYLLIEMD